MRFPFGGQNGYNQSRCHYKGHDVHAWKNYPKEMDHFMYKLSISSHLSLWSVFLDCRVHYAIRAFFVVKIFFFFDLLRISWRSPWFGNLSFIL